MNTEPFDLNHIIEQEADAHRIVDAVHTRQTWFPQLAHRHQLADQAVVALRNPFGNDHHFRIVVALTNLAAIPPERQRFATLERAADILTDNPTVD